MSAKICGLFVYTNFALYKNKKGGQNMPNDAKCPHCKNVLPEELLRGTEAVRQETCPFPFCRRQILIDKDGTIVPSFGCLLGRSVDESSYGGVH